MLVTEIDNELGKDKPSWKFRTVMAGGSALGAIKADAETVWKNWQTFKSRLTGSRRDARFIRLVCDAIPDLALRYQDVSRLPRLPTDKDFLALVREFKR
ncbi:hypothetical protein BSQ40_28640 [Serratia fonticola]|nr:hypothetical protein BSQ40_28640 [Serratia fonticola]